MTTNDSMGENGSVLGDEIISEPEFLEAFGQTFEQANDIDNWDTGEELGFSERLEREVADAQGVHDYTRSTIRNTVIPRLRESPFAPPDVGLHRVTPGEVDQALRGILFAGHVEAVDGTSAVIDMLPLTIIQLGVCSTSYNGQRGEWGHRMFRQDLRRRGSDVVEDTLKLLEARRNRTGYERSSKRDRFSDLTRRGMMALAERRVLAGKCTAMWRMGHGNPLSYELLMGSGMPALIRPGVDAMRELILTHEKFVFVPSSKADRWHETIGMALQPLEYVIIETMEPYLRKIIKGGHYGETGAWADARKSFLDPFFDDVFDKVVVGVYRVSHVGPPHIFYAHRDHAHIAATIALADSALHEHRGFPMLIDLAHTLCGTMFKSDTLTAQTETAFADAGATLDYATERMSR